MKRRQLISARPAKRRVTLTLPANSLREAQRLADARNVNLNAIIIEAVNEGLRVQARAERSVAVMEGYRKAFSGFSEEELLALDGIILEPIGRD